MRHVRWQDLTLVFTYRVLRRTIVVLGMLSVFVARVATAEPPLSSPYHFEMLEGQGVEVCEACLKAMEAIAWGPDRVGLSGCERNYESTLGLSAPNWTELEPLKHLALLKKVMMFLLAVDPKRGVEGTIFDGDNFKREIKGLLKGERLAVAMAMIDVDNDGHSEPVFKYQEGFCGNPQAPGQNRALLVLTPDRKSIDRAKTDVMMQNLGKESHVPAGDHFNKIYDVFSFKGQLYFDQWDRSPDPDIVTVYRAEGKRVTSPCKFRYQ